MAKYVNLLIVFLFFFVLEGMCILSFDKTDPIQTKPIQSYVRSKLGIDVEAVEKFSIHSPTDPAQGGKLHIQIEKGNKKIKIVLLRTQSAGNRFRLIFMEEVTRFGNEKSFLNIRTSRGSSEPKAKAESLSNAMDVIGFSSHQAVQSPQQASEMDNSEKLSEPILEQRQMEQQKIEKMMEKKPVDMKAEIGRISYLVGVLKEINKLKVRASGYAKQSDS